MYKFHLTRDLRTGYSTFGLSVDLSNDATDSLKPYRIIHEEILNGTRKEKIVYGIPITAYGYANRMYSVISTMLIAILTDSA